MLKPLRHNTEIKIPHFFYTDIFDSISWINVGYLYIFIRVYMNYTYFWAYGVTHPSTNDMDKMRMNLFCLLLSQFSNQTITIWICLYVRFYLARSPAYLWQFAYIKTFWHIILLWKDYAYSILYIHFFFISVFCNERTVLMLYKKIVITVISGIH